MNAPPPSSLPLATLLAHTADAVAAVCAGRSLNDALAAVPALPRPGAQALAFRVLRGLGLAQALRRRLVPKAPPAWVDALLLSAFALAHQDADTAEAPPYAPHTLVSQAVEAAKLRARAQAGFVNAVLRRYLREQPALVAATAKDPVAKWNHPRWWIETLQRDWPQHWADLLRANDRRAPMTLRVNARQQDRASYLQRLAQAGIAARAVTRPGAADGQAIELAVPCAVSLLPGFTEGAVSVQDLAAQQAAPLLLGTGLPPGARVLDACAAPGGKTAHLLELADLDLLALDADAQRLVKVRETLQRLGLRAHTQAADARDVASWWDGRPFDAILLDAPCSASGIVRRHPDVRWLRRASDIEALASTQAGLLDALWPVLRPGGRLLYATCSVFKAEGVQQIDAFLQRAPDAIERPSPGYLLPVADNPDQGSEGPPQPSTDGFYYALLDKRSS
ncbi:16S rRNA (cytosine(967)-C(5))-methyltransferase RsmB [Methylibium sp.]|uniref:16S rRNA (cytosine(967)-C(5))-methyltransferase RsmB n=1 Tax=Methylibium sp. TaxID=2067992 RepID=UPI00333E5E78